MTTFNLTTTPIVIDDGSSDFIAVNNGDARISITRGGLEVDQLRPGARGVYYLEHEIPLYARTVAGAGTITVVATAKNSNHLLTLDEANSTYVPLALQADGVTYDALARVATSTEGGVTTTYTYNADGTVNTESRLGKTKTYTYSTGRLTGSVVT